MAHKKIKLISFDLDDTLWDGKKLIHNAHQAMLEWIIKQQPALTSAQLNVLYFAQREEILRTHPHMGHHPSFIRKQTLQGVFSQLDFTEEQANSLTNDAFQVFYQQRNRVEFFPNVIDSLRTLKKQYQLTAITNGNANPETTGLGTYLDFFISAEEAGFAKPDPGIFELMLKKSQTSAEECVHIGDHPQLDIVAAQQVGMKTMWFNPEGRSWSTEVKPDQEFKDFDKLAYLIKQAFEE